MEDGTRKQEVALFGANLHISQPSNLRRLYVATVRKLSAAGSREREFSLPVFVFKISLF